MKILKKQDLTRRSLTLGILMIFMVGSGVIFAKKEKPGATLIVEKKNGEIIKGELLAVKDGTLTLLVYESASKVDVRLKELGSLRIVKKDASFKGFLIGTLAGAATGALVGFGSGDEIRQRGFQLGGWGWIGDGSSVYTAGEKARDYGVGLALIGGLVGTISGALSGTDKFIQLDDAAPEKLVRVEAKLASLARNKIDQVTYWKFTFTGPSDETHIVTFIRIKDSRCFYFPGITGYAGTYSDDGKNINLALTNHPTIQFNGQSTVKNTMTGTWANNGEIWNWTATRSSGEVAVGQVPVPGSRLFPE